jgi:hypothetical protein
VTRVPWICAWAVACCAAYVCGDDWPGRLRFLVGGTVAMPAVIICWGWLHEIAEWWAPGEGEGR